MEHMKFETPDLVEGNIDKIAALFPSAVTEMQGEDGKVKKGINFEVLKQLLSKDVVDGDECYEFTWVGKKAAMAEAAKPTTKTLRPVKEDSKNWDTTENLYIEGDNLEALKILQESYLGKVKMIYIDPPYNTGHDFVYPDSFVMDNDEYSAGTGYFDEDGNVNYARENTANAGKYHSDWCSMMYSRLVLARNLLTEDGVIFISIDDHEVNNLKKICDIVFGEGNFAAQIAWQRTYSPRNDSKGIANEVEYILVYSKQCNWMPGKLPRTAEMDAKYKNPDNDIMPWTSSDAFAPGAVTHQGMVYAIQHPFTGELIYPYSGACWRYQQNQMLEIMSGWCEYKLEDLCDEDKRAKVCGIPAVNIRKGVKGIVLADSLDNSKRKAQAIYERGQWPRFYFTQNGTGGIRRKTYIDSVEGKTPTNLFVYADVGHTDEAKKELKGLFDNSIPFDTPKPVRLLDRLITISTNKDDIVMDFFSGSATTAHAVIQKNSEDMGNRKFILVQVEEKSQSEKYETLCDVGKERIRRSGDKIKAANPLGTKDLDIGFRVFRVDDSNMKNVYYHPEEMEQGRLSEFISNIKEDRTDMDLLYSCLLDWGVEINLPHTTTVIDGCTVHNVDNGALMACFNENVPASVIQYMAKQQPLRAVFRDSGFAADDAKINVEETFKNFSPDTSVRVI